MGAKWAKVNVIPQIIFSASSLSEDFAFACQ